MIFNHTDDFQFDPDAFWKIIENADKKGYIMTTACGNDNQDAKFDSHGNQ